MSLAEVAENTKMLEARHAVERPLRMSNKHSNIGGTHKHRGSKGHDKDQDEDQDQDKDNKDNRRHQMPTPPIVFGHPALNGFDIDGLDDVIFCSMGLNTGMFEGSNTAFEVALHVTSAFNLGGSSTTFTNNTAFTLYPTPTTTGAAIGTAADGAAAALYLPNTMARDHQG
ncbi:hypothetical protein B0H10DRAFT_1959127 [Mycena sp. CBHHK59/15]|nr:hypothetical protein B0H10DRAFT_1959127 [Mycena sp. CBHHK59/15]